MSEKPTPDAAAAHAFLTEIWTRIATQRLHFSHGDEKTALSSLHSLYAAARDIIDKHYGCETFAATTIAFLNGDFRVFMADWHRRSLAGDLDTRDGAVEFRDKLKGLQDKFRELAKELHLMAYGTTLEDFPPDRGPSAPPDDVLTFGIPKDGLVPDDDPPMSLHIIDRINTAERAALAKRRKMQVADPAAPPDILNATGLALSGGGIRSASFCLGVVQALAERKKVFNSIDLMSTVSGGGYTGGFVARRLADGKVQDLAHPFGPDTDAIKYLRQRASYLDTGSFLQTMALVVSLLAGMILNWTAPAALIALAVTGAYLIDVFVQPSWTGLPTMAAGGAGLAMLVYAWMPRFLAQTRLVLMWTFWSGAAVLLAACGIAWGYRIFEDALSGNWVSLTTMGATVAAISPIVSRLVPKLGQEWLRRLANVAALFVASIAVPFLALVFGYGLFWLFTAGAEQLPASWLAQMPGLTGWHLATTITVFLCLTAGITIDINATGPHWLYRDRLANTFVRLREDQSAHLDLSKLDPDQKAPYLLMNAVVNLPASHRVELRERQGDFFLFSKHWCGSPLVGYRPTSHWKRQRKEVDLATGIATSGAAVAPHMGLLSFVTARALLSFLNIRLGVWMRNPKPGPTPPAYGGRPGAIQLLKEMTGFGMKETAAWMMLTDGAHLENSGVYELLRRRCKFIVAVDASADPEGQFDTILTLVRHAAIDMGIRMHADLSDLRPDPETKLTRAHGVLCEVDYPSVKGGPPAGKGILLIIKLSMTGNENELINAYRKANSDFPNQSTTDQFFDEHQFEAYRQLGAHAAGSLFEEALVGEGEVQDMADWLKRLYLRIPPRVDVRMSGEGAVMADRARQQKTTGA